jgi:hypothetical protein
MSDEMATSAPRVIIATTTLASPAIPIVLSTIGEVMV